MRLQHLDRLTGRHETLVGLIDDLANIDQFGSAVGPRCTVCRFVSTLDDKEADVFTAALTNDNVTMNALARALAKNGHKIAAGTLARHKKGECRGAK